MKKIASIVTSFVVLLGGHALADQSKLAQYSAPTQNSPAQTAPSQNQNPAANNASDANNAQNVMANILNIASNSQLGNYLVGSNGMTLYKTSNDKNDQSFCTGQCESTWIPYTVNSGVSLNVGNQIRGRISTITRSDGINQVTYNGMPLYTFSGDSNQGDTNGQGNDGWSVAKP